ncbi:class I SAM-dependent methyltransferase [Castellaniella sp.]|uniref:class I SAM-dependent methyltransferase n=1 Tax=Castellaniella sp. TaxID=1955812 RepID=UPI003562DFE3
MSFAWNPAAYDAWYDSPKGRWIGQAEYRLMLRELGFPEEGRLLDVGCGTGWFTRQLALRAGLHVTGADLSADALDYARSRDPRALYVQADALDLPFPGASFDYVWSIAALCFTTHWRRAVAQMVRVTRGRFAIGMLNRHSLLWREKGREGGSESYRGAVWLSPDEFAAGFDGLNVRDLRLRHAIFWPSAHPAAPYVEQWLPSCLPYGGLMVMSGGIAQ